METIEEAIAGTRMFRNLTPEQLGKVVSLGEDADFADGAYLLQEGQPADWFFVIREGFVALQTEVPSVGAITIETLHHGDPVGWWWLFEPYLSEFDARSRGLTHAIRFDARTLRRRFAEDSMLGYELMRSFASVIVECLQATRLQLLDVYGRAPVS
jgi:CRP/FNR family transcriptional regulator, cyclic AMP receptor protein